MQLPLSVRRTEILRGLPALPGPLQRRRELQYPRKRHDGDLRPPKTMHGDGAHGELRGSEDLRPESTGSGTSGRGTRPEEDEEEKHLISVNRLIGF